MTDHPPHPVDDVREVARRLALLPEPGMRSACLRDIVLARAPESAAWLLDALASAGRGGGPPFDVSLLAAVELTSGTLLGYTQRRTLYEAADHQGLEACKDLLFTAGDAGPVDAAPSAPRALSPGTRPLTLGERKALARSWRRDVLERLFADPAQDVVALLLENPRVTEDDVLRIVSTRRASAPVLELVLMHRRWNCRPRVRRALLHNRRLPEASALRLVGLLNRTDLIELQCDPHLPLRVVASLQRRLAPAI
jgi:hypothetical protein